MDLFTALAEDYSVTESMDERVREIVDFVLALEPAGVERVVAAQKKREFTSWQNAAKAMRDFAYEQGLKEHWWSTVELLKSNFRGEFWNPAWDAAFDYSLALLLKPWAGKTWPQSDYELLTEPLRAAGFSS